MSQSDIAHPDTSHLAEKFGAGVAAAVVLGALVGVVATALLGLTTGEALIVSVGVGFLVAPLAGIAFSERGE